MTVGLGLGVGVDEGEGVGSKVSVGSFVASGEGGALVTADELQDVMSVIKNSTMKMEMRAVVPYQNPAAFCFMKSSLLFTLHQ